MAQYLAIEELTKQLNGWITKSLSRFSIRSLEVALTVFECCRDNALVYLMDSVELKQDEVIPQAIATVARHFQVCCKLVSATLLTSVLGGDPQSYPPSQLVDLPPDIFRAITNMDKINISSENDIFNAVSLPVARVVC